MIGTTEVITEVRKLADTKPVYAAAGAGVAATAALRDLPGRLTKLSQETAVPSWSAAVSSFNGTVTTLPTVVQSLPARWAGYVSTARTVAADRYDKLADIGREALGQGKATHTKGALNGKTTKATTKATKSATKQTGQ